MAIREMSKEELDIEKAEVVPPLEESAAVEVAETEVKAETEQSFAHGLNYYKLFWIFFIGCVIGVIVETIWCLITQHKIESRAGLVYGPFNPVYGVGALAMTLCLNWLAKKSDFLIFIGSAVIGGLFETVCSMFQEFVFNTVSWAYNDKMLGILGGRTSILYMIFWGILGLMWIKEVYPRLSRLIEKIPNKFGRALTLGLSAFMVINILVSSAAALRLEARKTSPQAKNVIERVLDERFPDSRMNLIYPNLIPKDKKNDPNYLPKLPS